MAQAHEPDREAAAADRRFIIRSEDEAEAIELANRHMRNVHGQDYPDEERRSNHLKIV